MSDLDNGATGEGGGEGGTPNEHEVEARKEGWRPKEEYRGNPEEWIDAETFVRRGREINPILRRNNERLQRELDGLRGELREASTAVKGLVEYNQTIEKKAYERAMRSLKAERKAALIAGEHEQVAELDEQLDDLKDNPPAAVKAPAPAPAPAKGEADPILREWMAENASWFNEKTEENADMVAYANAKGQQLRRRDPQMTKLVGREFLDAIREAVEKQFPDRFGRKGGPAMVEGGGAPTKSTSPAAKQGKIASLPTEERQEFKRLSGEKWYQDLAKSKNLTPEQMYLSDYGDQA